MQAFQVAYSPDESKIALGWPTGLIEIAAVNPEDGSPGEPLCRSFFHKKEITFLAFLGEDELLSVDERGRAGVIAVASGDVVRQIDLGGSYACADLSPSRASLFVYVYESKRGTNTFAIDVTTFDSIFGPEASDLSVRSRVFAVNDRTAAFYLYQETDISRDDAWEGDERVDEALIFIDFNSGTIDKRLLDGGPASTFGDLPVFAINAREKFGVRCAFAAPLEISEVDDTRYLDIDLEVFDLETLSPIRNLLVGGLPLGEGSEELVALVQSKSRKDVEYREKVSDLFENITSLAITDDGKTAWIGVRGGLIRRVRLDGGARSKLVKHGGEPERDTMTLDEVFARNIRNNQTLGISGSGTYVAFGNPNEFFCSRDLEDGQGRVELPQRPAALNEAEAPSFLRWVAGGELLVVGTAGGYVFLVDASSGDVLFGTQVPYGDHLNAASLSPDRTELILAYAGRASLRVRLREGAEPEIVELPLPPHTVFARHLNDDLVVLANSNGAVVTLEGDTLHAFRNDDDHGGDDDDEVDFEDAFDDDFDEEFDEEPDEELEDDDGPPAPWQLKNPEGVEPLQLVGNMEGVFVYNDYFEQKQDVYDVTGCFVGDGFHVFVLLEDGDIEVYRIGDERIEHAFTHTGKWLKGLAAANETIALFDLESGEAQLFRWAGDGLEKLLSFTDDGLRMVGLAADGRDLFLFNELTGVVSAMSLADRREQELLRYTGPAVRGMSFDPTSHRAAMVEGNGNCVLLDFATGARLGNLRVEPSGDERRVSLGGEPVGTVDVADALVTRELATEAEVQQAEEEHSRKADLFHAGPRGDDERRVAAELAAAAEKIDALVEKRDYRGQVDLLDRLLRDFEERDYFTVRGSNRFRNSIGAAFAQRGEAFRGLEDHEAAARDFGHAVAYHYYVAYLSRIEQLTDELHRFDDALELIDEVLLHYDAKSSIGLRKSTPLYRARTVCLIELGRIDDAHRTLTEVVESLVAYLEGEAKSEELVPLREDLARLAATSELAQHLAQWFTDVLERFPSRPPKDEARSAELDTALRRARFFEMNGRQRELVHALDEVLRPHEDSKYFGADMPSGVKHKLGDFWGLRGQARLGLGEAQAALADFVKAIEFRDVNRYTAALEVCYFDLGDFATAERLMRSFAECPFNWGSEYWNPFKRVDYAYILTLAALGDRLRGREGDLEAVRRLYGGEVGKVSALLRERTANRPQRFAAESVIHFLRG